MAIRSRVKIYFDGGFRPLPVGMELSVVIKGVITMRRALGNGSAMEAEWRALVFAAECARDQAIADPVLVGDALGVIQQARGEVKISSEHRAFADQLRALYPDHPLPPIRHIKRQQNLAGIALASLHPR